MTRTTRQRIEQWIARQLQNPAPVGGRNNQIVQVAPRMLELGWDEDGILQAFLEAFGCGDDKADEILAAIQSSARYATVVDERSQKEIARAKARREMRVTRARRMLPTVLRDYKWTRDEMEKHRWPDFKASGYFLHGMFKMNDVVWMGQVHQSGYNPEKKRDYRRNFRPVHEWLTTAFRGPFISHCTFHPGTESRNNQSMATRPYYVVESDRLGIDEVGAIFNWLVTRGSKLRAVVFSGKRSLHGWFDYAGEDIEELSDMLVGLDCDPACLRASQPVRLPGVIRPETRLHQSLLWFNPPFPISNGS